MVARRSRSKTADENRRAITPDAAGRNSPRSRKCLDLAPAEVRPSPLAEQKTANGWTREEFTPLKGEKEKPRMWSGEEDAGSLLGPPSVASSDIFPRTPFSVLPYTPATPRSSGRSISRSVLVSVSKRRSAHGRSSSALPDQFKIVPASPAPPMEKRVEPAAIQSSSFYAAASDENTAGDKPKEKEESYVDLVRRRRKESQRVVKDKARRAGARRSFGGGGSRRKGGNATGRRGCFHAIKKPKKKLKVNVKISQMPAMSIEIPNSKNAKAAKSPATPKTPIVPKVSKTSTLTPKMGNFALSKETSVDIEVKGGQIIYRKSNTTPLRRSPRKNMSPLKQSYFHGSAPRSRSSGKLFSPGADFLVPDSASPTKHIPSPVKFCSVSTNEDDEEEETNISDLIERLGSEDDSVLGSEDGSVLDVMDTEVELAPGSIVSSQFLDTDSAATAFKAVQDILGAMGDSESSLSQCSEDEDTEDVDLTNKDTLFPIFYKDKAQTGEGTGEGGDAPRSSGRPRRPLNQDPRQLQIDAGQERGPTLCLECGAVYTIGDGEDEASHERAHNSVMNRLRFSGWRLERNCGPVDEGRVIMVQPGDPKHWWRKVDDALTIVDRDLGFSEVGIRFPEQTKVFLYVTEKQIGGLLLAESIPNGFRVLQQKSETGKVYMCSETPQPVICGISRIWVFHQFRRSGVASRLVDSMRSFFLLGKYLGEDDFAFSDPTLNGMDFASKYMGRSDFLVYSR